MTTVSRRLPRLSFVEFCANARIALPAITVCACMAVFGIATSALADVSAWPLLSYFDMAQGTLLCLLLVACWSFGAAAFTNSDLPVTRLRKRVVEGLPLLLLPAIVLPAFLIGYTSSKTAIPVLVGYSWDAFWANCDRLLFGDDVWKISRSIFGNSSASFWAHSYSVGWGTVFVLSANFVTLLGRRRFVGVFFTAMLASWLIGGVFLAYLFSAAGPVFAPEFDPSLAQRFLPLQHLLENTSGNDGVRMAQEYLLVAAQDSHVAMKGGGISAMPSMHVATVTIYVMAARRTPWLIPAVLFWILIFIGSAYSGFHYWIDGVIAAALAVGCWQVAAAFFSERPERSTTGELQPSLAVGAANFQP